VLGLVHGAPGLHEGPIGHRSPRGPVGPSRAEEVEHEIVERIGHTVQAIDEVDEALVAGESLIRSARSVISHGTIVGCGCDDEPRP
jgi:hypothetical protein